MMLNTSKFSSILRLQRLRAAGFDVGTSGGVVSVSPAGDIYAASENFNTNIETVKVFKPNTNVPAYSFSFPALLPSFQFDGASNLYVDTMDSYGNNRGILVYPPGSSSPSYEITNGVSKVNGLCVNLTTGTLYATNYDSTIAVFAPGAASPSYVIASPPSGTNAGAIAVDRWDNLYVNYQSGSTPYVAIYAPGSSTIASQLSVPNSWGVAINSR